MSGKVYRRHHRHHQHSLRCVFCVILILLLLAFVELGFEHHNITGVCTCKMYHRRTIENEWYVLTIAFQLHMRTWPVSGAMSNAHYQRILLVKEKWIWPMDWFTFSHAQASSIVVRVIFNCSCVEGERSPWRLVALVRVCNSYHFSAY